MCGVASSINTAKFTPPTPHPPVSLERKRSKQLGHLKRQARGKKIHPEKNCFIALNSGFHPIQSESRKNFTGAELLQNLSCVITDKRCYKIHYPFYFRSVMGQVNYNLSFSVWIAGEGPMECRHWHSALIRRSFKSFVCRLLLLRWTRWNLKMW